MRPPHVAVFGSSHITAAHPAWDDAVLLGRGLAEAGCVLVTGGYGGVMEAASRGAADAGGHTIGLTVRNFVARPPNAAVAQEIPAEDLLERLRNFVEHADMFIALYGGVGTLLEIALLWNLKVLNAHDGPPVWLVGAEWERFYGQCRRDLAIRPRDFGHVALIADAAAAVSAVRAHLASLS